MPSQAAATKYCRAYKTFQFTGSGSPKFEASTIGVSDCSTATLWSSFYAKSRMGAAKAAIVQAVGENSKSARFGLITMRQGSTPTIASGNDGQVQDDDTGQSTPSDTGLPGYWKVTRGLLSVASPNGNWNAAASSPVAKVQADSSTANTDIVTILNKTFTTSGAILPAGNDTSSQQDAPLANLVSDVKTEATRLIAADSSCRNTIAVLVVGGAEGTFGTAPGTSAANLATGFKSISSRRVPIYVIAIAPPSGDVSALQSIATNSGGQYFQVDPVRNRHRGRRRVAPAHARPRHRHGGAARHGEPVGREHRADGVAALRPAERVSGHQPDHRLGRSEGRQGRHRQPRCRTRK